MEESKRNKIIIFLMFLIGLLLLVPSTFFLEKIREYRDFFSGINPGVLKQTGDNMIPEDLHKNVSFKPRLSFVEFKIKVPKAKEVYLIGNFNHWAPKTIKMMKKESGEWSVFLPLPKGRCQYLFVVDGKKTTDPKNPHLATSNGETVSVRQIQ